MIDEIRGEYEFHISNKTRRDLIKDGDVGKVLLFMSNTTFRDADEFYLFYQEVLENCTTCDSKITLDRSVGMYYLPNDSYDLILSLFEYLGRHCRFIPDRKKIYYKTDFQTLNPNFFSKSHLYWYDVLSGDHNINKETYDGYILKVKSLDV